LPVGPINGKLSLMAMRDARKKWHIPATIKMPRGIFLLLMGAFALLLVGALVAVGSSEGLRRTISSHPFLSSFKLPQEMSFAGQPVPLDHWQVRERIEYEFYQFLGNEGESIIIAKRTGRCFPVVERMLREAGLPDDLKFVLLVESKCVSSATSAAKAVGPWQFLSSTGRRFALESNYWKDERRDLERSTEAAIKYLQVLHGLFDDWYLALAAYNAGDQRVRSTLRDQKVEDYWKAHFSSETMRYIPRILAVKEIFSRPDRYLGLTKEELYAPMPTEVVTVRIPRGQEHLANLAEEYGSYFLELKLLNPQIRKDHLPAGTHQIRVPQQKSPACPEGCDS